MNSSAASLTPFSEFRGERLDPRRGNGGPMHKHRQVPYATAYSALRRQAFRRTIDAAGVEGVLQMTSAANDIAEYRAVE